MIFTLSSQLNDLIISKMGMKVLFCLNYLTFKKLQRTCYAENILYLCMRKTEK